MKQTRRGIFLCMLVLVGALFTGCGAFMEEQVREISKILDFTMEDKILIEDVEEKRTYNFQSDKYYAYAYSFLSENEQQWYHDINSILAQMGEEMPLNLESLLLGVTEDDIDRIFQCVMLDHPEYFYVEGYNYKIFTRLDQIMKIEFSGKYTMERDEAVRRADKIATATREILADAPMKGDDYDKIAYVYDKIILQTEYNLNATDNQNIYSVLVGKESVCQGYAKTVQYLLSQLDVDATLVLGHVIGGEGHAWNLVKSNGQFYYVDATWGDASYRLADGEESEIEVPEINYDYLCVTTDAIGKTHTVNSVISMPECVDTADNYYVRNGCMFKDYNTNQIKTVIQKALDENSGYFTFKCETRNVYDMMKKRLIEEKLLFTYLGQGITSLSFTENEEQLTLTFWMTNS